MSDAFVERKQTDILINSGLTPTYLEINGDNAGNAVLTNTSSVGDIQFDIVDGLLRITGMNEIDYSDLLELDGDGNAIPNKAYVDSHGGSGGGVPYSGATMSVDLNTQNIFTSHVPSGNDDLTNKLYVDTKDALRVPYTGASGSVNLGAQRIYTTYVPTADADLTNKLYVDGRTEEFRSVLVDFAVTAPTTIYTVPAGFALLVSEMEIYCSASAGSAAGPTVKFGINGDDDLFWGPLASAVSTQYTRHIIRSDQAAQPATTQIIATITGASGDAKSGYFIIRGTLISNP